MSKISKISEMELIIIKGKSNIGKTTIATLLHNKLAQIEGIKLKWMEYDHWFLPMEEKDLCPDFRSVFFYKDKTIGIVSHGDSSRYAKCFIKHLISEFNVKILIVCSNVDSNNWNMLNRDFGEYVKEENIFEVDKNQWTKDKNEKISVKESFVCKILKKIDDIVM